VWTRSFPIVKGEIGVHVPVIPLGEAVIINEVCDAIL
jgi:hypothetical protein